MFIYKIKHTQSGLFSSGGAKPSFSATGKSWTSIGHLRNHITRVIEKRRDYDACEVVKLELSEVDSFSLNTDRSGVFVGLERISANSPEDTSDEITTEEIESGQLETASATDGSTPW